MHVRYGVTGLIASRTCFIAGGIYVFFFLLSLWQARLSAERSARNASFA